MFMTLLILGLVLFFVPHLMSVLAPGARESLKGGLSDKAFKGIYALVSWAGLILIIWGFYQGWYGGGGDQQVYTPPTWGRHITMLLVLLGFISLGASHGKGRLRLLLKNPMSIGIVLWAAGHLLANGRLADLLLFGSFLIYGLLDIATAMGRGKLPSYTPNARSDVIAVVVGLVLYALFLLVIHPYVFGIHVLQ